MSILDLAGYAILFILAVYLIVRIGSAAFFNSKRDYDERLKNGTQNNKRP